MKNTDCAKRKGYDAGKKILRIKRYIAVDTQGLPHAIAVTTADITDRNGSIAAGEQQKENLNDVLAVLTDGGYTGEPFSTKVGELPGATAQIAKHSELNTFAVLLKRWIVERSFGWIEKCRRLWKNCERKLNTSLQFVNLAFLALLLRIL